MSGSTSASTSCSTTAAVAAALWPLSLASAHAGIAPCHPLYPWSWARLVLGFAVPAAGCFWSTVSTALPSALFRFAGLGAHLGVWARARAGRRTEGENIPNVDGPSAEVMALSAVADTIAEYKRALATNDFKDEMSLDPRERALVIGTADHATLTYASPRRHLDAGSIGGRRAMSDGIFNLIAGPDRFISKEVRFAAVSRRGRCALDRLVSRATSCRCKTDPPPDQLHWCPGCAR